ncbi:TetR/AcrR family transcriptional regulator [Oricola indica]|uniref:TetR/AcrR family transcriptional regulator n=1 Tax=Oricola indica TaxID=2872591 RepID=UPI003CCB7C95
MPETMKRGEKAGNSAGKKAAPRKGDIPPTKERILDAAERLFVRYGYKGVSMRLLTRESKVNLGAVHYHFGGMESVLRALFEKHIVPLNQERHELLDKCLAEEADTYTSVRNLIEAYIRPSLRYPASSKPPKSLFARLQAQLSVDPSPEVRRVIDRGYDEIGTRFARMLRAHCPHLADHEFFWRLNCLYGTMFYTQADTGRTQKIAELMGVEFDQTDRADDITLIAGFLASGFLAPAVDTSTSPAATAKSQSGKSPSGKSSSGNAKGK